MARSSERCGWMPWRRVLEPAAVLAEDGFHVTEAQRVSWCSDEGPDKPGGLARMAYSENGRGLYTDNGQPLPLGHRIRNPDLAPTMRHLTPSGAHDFYRGDLAEATAPDLAKHQSLSSP